MHVTHSDNKARHAVQVLYNLQVRPLLDALGLAPDVTGLDTLDFWWWSLQGLLLMVLVEHLASRDSPCEDYDGDDVPEALVVVAGGSLLRVEEAREDLPDLLELCYHAALPPV